MLALALVAAAAGAAPHPGPVRVEANATVRIVRPAIISAAAQSKSPASWREANVHLPDGTIEQLRVIDLP